MMNTNVDALKNLYEQLGGDPADVANCSTSVEVLNAIAAKYGGADDAIINPDAINNIAAVASSIGGGGADLAALIDRSITSISIPEGATAVGAYVFRDCTALKSVTIPEGVTSIGSNAFYRCSALEDINIPEGVTSIGATAFYHNTVLSNLIIPSSVTSIGANAFQFVGINVAESASIKCRFSEGAVSGAPWGAQIPIIYDYND